MKLYFKILLIICIPLSAIAQSAKDSAKGFQFMKDNVLSFGLYSGENLTSTNPYNNYQPALGSITSYIGRGFDDELLAKIKAPEGLTFGWGLCYEMQSYALSQVRSTDSIGKLTTIGGLNFSSYNNDHYFGTYKNYLIGIPLSIGYNYAHNRYSYYFSLGIEFYYNYKTEWTYSDSTSGKIILQATFTKGRTNWYWYPPGIFPNGWWGNFGAYGVLSAGMSYRFTKRFSLAFEPTLRFTNPFGPDGYAELPSQSKGQATFSLDLGLNYNINLENSGPLLSFDEEKKPLKYSVGFFVIPNYFNDPGINKSLPTSAFSYSYLFSVQMHLTGRTALESGISIDNFNNGLSYSAVYLGLPIIFKYYFPIANSTHSFYLGAGSHVDYLTNIENVLYGVHVLRNLAITGLIEAGYEAKLGNNYFIDLGLGYQHIINDYYYSTTQYYNTSGIAALPDIFFGMIGLNYRFR